MTTKQVSCYNCHSNRNTLYDTENGFNLVKCLDCGLLYVNPRPLDTEIDQAAQTGQHAGDNLIDTTGAFNEQRVRNYLSILRDFYPDTPDTTQSRSWLDIGAGHGEFLKAIQMFVGSGLQTKGLEPNANKRASAAKRGLDIGYFDLDKHAEAYDFVSLLNVFSHLPDPVDALTKWKRLVKVGGELLLETGDSANLDRKHHHRPYYLPDHLSFASEDIVVGILERVGFRVLDIKKYRSPAYPVFTLGNLFKQAVKLIRPNRQASFNFFPKHGNTDMWIRAKRIN